MNLELLGIESRDLIPLEESQDILLTSKAHRAFLSLREQALKDDIDIAAISGYRSFERQLAIWNAKANGQRVILDSNGDELNYNELSKSELLFSILRWSALPGASRHHWGTDLDIIDNKALKNNPGYKVQLIPSEYKNEGIFEKLGNWLDFNLSNSDFFRPYLFDLGGVANEPWHLSYISESQQNYKEYHRDFFFNFLESEISNNISLIETIRENKEKIFSDYIENITLP